MRLYCRVEETRALVYLVQITLGAWIVVTVWDGSLERKKVLTTESGVVHRYLSAQNNSRVAKVDIFAWRSRWYRMQTSSRSAVMRRLHSGYGKEREGHSVCLE